MNHFLGFVLFLTIFLMLFLGINYYVFHQTAKFFNIQKGTTFYITLVIMTFIFILASILVNKVHSIFARIFYIIASSWLGILFIAFFTILAYDIISRLFGISRFFSQTSIGLTLLGIIILVSAYGFINASFIKVKHVDVNIGADNIKIVQLSDIHIGAIHDGKYLKKIVQKVNSLNPDIVVITGDLVDGSGFDIKSFEPLKDIKAKTFMVIGNHETFDAMTKLSSIVKNNNITLLRNYMEEYKGVQIIGVDYVADRNYLAKILPNIDFEKNKPSILLQHTPTELDVAAKNNIGLQLSGHTHNGQMFPFNLIEKPIYPYMNGLYKLNNTYLYVSPGTGTWGPRMRLFTHNEITVINIS
jgi:predicted MPP superfamily phosphohydrolase